MDPGLVEAALRLTEVGAYGLLILFIIALSRRVLIWAVDADRRYDDMVKEKDKNLLAIIAEKDRRFDDMVKAKDARIEDIRTSYRERLEEEQHETNAWKESGIRTTAIMDRTVALLQELEARYEKAVNGTSQTIPKN